MRKPIVESAYGRLHGLEQRFAALEQQIAESPEKQAISVLHGMVQEPRRSLRMQAAPNLGGGLTPEDIANLYKQAPRWRGRRSTHHCRLGHRHRQIRGLREGKRPEDIAWYKEMMR